MRFYIEEAELEEMREVSEEVFLQATKLVSADQAESLWKAEYHIGLKEGHFLCLTQRNYR